MGYGENRGGILRQLSERSVNAELRRPTLPSRPQTSNMRCWSAGAVRDLQSEYPSPPAQGLHDICRQDTGAACMFGALFLIAGSFRGIILRSSL